MKTVLKKDLTRLKRKHLSIDITTHSLFIIHVYNIYP